MPARSRKRGRREAPVMVADPRPPAVAQQPPETVQADSPIQGNRSTPRQPRAAAGSHAEAVSRRYADRNAQARATLVPLAPGERPRAVVVAAALAALLGVGNLIAFLAGAKIGGSKPAASGILGFSGLMLIAAWGMWRLRFWAVMGFMAILGIVATIFTLLLLRASNLPGFLIPPVIIAGSGFLFFKLVRALSRIQMPHDPNR